MNVREITFPSGAVTLAGTLTIAHEDHRTPAAVLISGSGPIDRDSNMSKLSIGVMRQIAVHLAEHGISTLRFDKRGVGSSSGDYLSTGFHDNVSDAAAAVVALRSQPAVNHEQIFVIGHSEGALIATELAARDPQLDGAVLLAGTATTGEQVLRWQAERVAASLPKPVKLLLRLLRKDLLETQAKRLAQIKATTAPTTRIQLVKLNAKWFREFMAHDPTPSLRKIRIPVLAATGSKDIQVDPGDVQRICDLVGPRCNGHIVDDMTHLLRTEHGAPSVRTYKKQAKRPIAPELMEIITDWLNERADDEAELVDENQVNKLDNLKQTAEG